MAADLLTPATAAVAGLATSLHCAVMCGPLACALGVRPLEYHGGRLLSYSVAGAIAGLAGGGLLGLLHLQELRLLPWVLAAILLVISLGLERRLPQPAWLSRWLLRLRLQRSLGVLTPLLPCGPLWLMLGAAATAGSWERGGLLMASFAAGTIPLPFFLHLQTNRLLPRLSPLALRRLQQVLALLAMAVTTWRALLPPNASCH